ncbi:hypothetical protein RJT34_12137 [Clitoria ternatea]|uniref:Poly [ADP-ribose] polymerase n=1 Tax=Clitoria ternatea TaxID=43366 RepID=A0AAN9JNC3_CLITE
MIEEYLKNTHAETHSNYNVDIVQIFRTSREDEVERFGKDALVAWFSAHKLDWNFILSAKANVARDKFKGESGSAKSNLSVATSL